MREFYSALVRRASEASNWFKEKLNEGKTFLSAEKNQNLVKKIKDNKKPGFLLLVFGGAVAGFLNHQQQKYRKTQLENTKLKESNILAQRKIEELENAQRQLEMKKLKKSDDPFLNSYVRMLKDGKEWQDPVLAAILSNPSFMRGKYGELKQGDASFKEVSPYDPKWLRNIYGRKDPEEQLQECREEVKNLRWEVARLRKRPPVVYNVVSEGNCPPVMEPQMSQKSKDAMVGNISPFFKKPTCDVVMMQMLNQGEMTQVSNCVSSV